MKLHLSRKKVALLVATTTVLVAAATGAALASSDDTGERAITGGALERATDAALQETGGGRVTATEVGDEESRYEVEVTLDGGSQVDVQLDEHFRVVGTEAENGSGDGEP